MFLRRGPQDLPYSPALLALLIAGMLTLSAVLAAQLTQVSVARTAFSMLLELGLTWAALRMAEKPERFVQAATAMVGASIVLTLLAIPILFGVDGVTEETKQLTRAQSLWVLFALLFHVWNIAITGHILRHALDITLRVGVLVAVVFFAVGLIAGAALFERAAS
jgi:hypothetical protein